MNREEAVACKIPVPSPSADFPLGPTGQGSCVPCSASEELAALGARGPYCGRWGKRGRETLSRMPPAEAVTGVILLYTKLRPSHDFYQPVIVLLVGVPTPF